MSLDVSKIMKMALNKKFDQNILNLKLIKIFLR